MSFKEFIVDRRKAIRTVVVWMTYVLYGATFILPGSSLLDLQVLTQGRFAEVSRILSMRSGGFLAGVFLASLLSKHLNIILVISGGLFFVGTTIILIPLTKSLMLMEIICFFSGVAQATFDIAGHTYMFGIWKEKATNKIQVIQMSFGVGAICGPLVVRPFMLSSSLPMNINELSVEDLREVLLKSFSPDQVCVHWAFMIFGVLILLSSLTFASFYFNEKSESHKGEESTKEVTCKNEVRERSVCKEIMVIAIVSLMENTYFGCQILISGFTQVYGVESALHMPKKEAALLAPSFFLTFVIGKITFLLLSFIITEWKLITFFMSLSILSSILLLFTAHSEFLLFIFLIVFGFAGSPLYGVALSFPSRYFQMTGTYTSTVFICGIIGEAIHAPIISILIDYLPVIFIYYLSCLTIVFTLSIPCLQWVCKRLFLPLERKEPISTDKSVGKGSIAA